VEEDVVQLAGPYDLAGTLRRTAIWGSDATIRFARDEVVLAMRLGSGPASVQYVDEGEGRIRSRAWGPGAREAIERAPAHLGAHDESWTFEHPHPRVGPFLRRIKGTRFGRTDRLVDRCVGAILGQKVASKQAARSFHDLLDRHGEDAPGPFGLRLAPGAAELRRLDYTDFHLLNVERRRAETILLVARRADRIEALAALPPAEAQAKLESLPGIGPWTSAVVVTGAMGATDVVTTGDWHFPHHVAHTLTGADRGTDDDMLVQLEPFRPHRARALLAILREGEAAPRFGPRMALRDIRRS